MPAAPRYSIHIQKNAPGPGSYTPIKTSGYPQYRFTRSIQRASFVTSKAPGPGAYSPSHSFTERRIGGPAIFGTTRNSYSFTEKIPGPGTYDTSNLFNVSSVKIAMVSRNNAWNRYKTSGPGPAAYANSVAEKPKGVKFNKARREATFDNTKAPGPGSYVSKSLIGTGTRKALILSRRVDTTSNTEGCSPGPCGYQIVDKGFKRGIRIGKSKRRFSRTNAIPGPSQYTPKYEIEKQSDPAWRYITH
jgi:hypothetical protein